MAVVCPCFIALRLVGLAQVAVCTDIFPCSFLEEGPKTVVPRIALVAGWYYAKMLRVLALRRDAGDGPEIEGVTSADSYFGKAGFDKLSA